MRLLFALIITVACFSSQAQSVVDATINMDTAALPAADTTLRIINLPAYVTQHVDSALNYSLLINRTSKNYYWYLRNAPVGLKINKDNGVLSFKADKTYFLSGRLQYDQPYKVSLSVQNMNNPNEKIDTSFTILFYNTEIIPSKLRPTVNNLITINEGETISFRVMCENGNFPIEHIRFFSSSTLDQYSLVENCGDEFRWSPGYDFVKETDSAPSRMVLLNFIGTTKFGVQDTATIRLVVKNALNYPLSVLAYDQLVKNINGYLLQLKYSFLQLDRRTKHTKTVRSSFDIVTATTSLTGTILNSQSSENAQKAGKILPSIGLSMLPIKEAVVPPRTVEQNQAGELRAAIKRLEYMLTENQLTAGKDPDIQSKTNTLKNEWKQAQVQLIDIPLEITNDWSPDELNRYFNSKKVRKKYRLK